MAKRISTIAPVEQLRGNLSGKQNLKYNDNNNSAFDAPEGKQYAVNYRKSYIGCMRQRDGLAYFQVKTKNCVNVTADAKMRMAASGGAFAIVAAIMRNRTSATYLKLSQILTFKKASGEVAQETTLRQFISEPIMNMLKHKFASVQFRFTPAGSAAPLIQIILNPWDSIDASQTTGAEISDSLIVKFWMQLAKDPVEYKVGGATEKLVAQSGLTFVDIASEDCNVNTLELTSDNDYLYSTKYGMWLNITRSESVETPFTVCVNDDIEPYDGAEYYLSDTKIVPEP